MGNMVGVAMGPVGPQGPNTSYRQNNIWGLPMGTTGAMGPLGPQGPGIPNTYSIPRGSAMGPAGTGSNSLTDQLNALWNMGIIANGPADQAINNNITEYQKQMALAQANQQMQTGYLNQDQALGNQRLDLQGGDILNRQQALNRQSPLNQAQHDLALQALAQREQEAWWGAQGQQRSLRHEAIPAGALQSQGAREGFGDIQKQLEFGLNDIGRNRQNENLSFAERQAQVQDQQKNLNLAAKSLGIDRQELTNKTQRALQQLGIDTAVSVSDITRAINDLNAGRYNPLQAMLGTIYQASGVRPVAGG